MLDRGVDGIPSIAHQLRHTYARSSIYRTSNTLSQAANSNKNGNNHGESGGSSHLVGPFRAEKRLLQNEADKVNVVQLE